MFHSNPTTQTWPKKKTKPAKTKAVKAPAKKGSKVKQIKYVYDFGKKTDGDAKQRELLGGKGANLAEMARIGLPVPPGFTITTEVCTYYYDNKKTYPKNPRWPDSRIGFLDGKAAWKKLGDLKKPLLLSVRSGDAIQCRA